MVQLNFEIRILLFVSLLILSVHALEISILNVLSDFKCKIKIKYNITANGRKIYDFKVIKPYYYEAFYPDSKIIAYIVDEPRFEEIAYPNVLEIRKTFGPALRSNNYELVIFGINDCGDNEFDMIGLFLQDIIKPHPNQNYIEIETMGEESFDQTYWINKGVNHSFKKYRETSQIYNGALQQHLRTLFPKMKERSKRRDPSNTKHVRFFEDIDVKRRYSKQVTWPIYVKNGEYIPHPDIKFNRNENNFLRRYKNRKYHILIVGGKEYDRLVTINYTKVRAAPWFVEITKIIDEMQKNNETLFIMGCFNFDWSDVDAVSQIILKHSECPPAYPYNVFTIGTGIFDTQFRNPYKYDERKLEQSANNELMKFVKKHFGETMREKSIEIINLNTLTVATNHIVHTINGRYVGKEYPFILPYPNVSYAFIVINTEMHYENIFSIRQTNPYVKMLQDKGIVLFVIKLNNFRLYDLHIIPEWIENNRGTVPPNRIAILGSGSCDTTFKFVSPEYQITYTLLDVANELKEIRKSFVATAGDKRIFLANINDPNFRFKVFPMHTINGVYDPVVISEGDMIPTEDDTKILFLIMGGAKFYNMTRAVPETIITDFRQSIASDYPLDKWRVYLVGLDNFSKKDSYLFSEFVKTHTNDKRSPLDFVHTFGDGSYQSAYEYRYRDIWPFLTVRKMADKFTEFFNAI